ncbi:TetR family transcriptional regulator [Streptomyces sp. PRKS01-65]|nr:TetR/AcrR family transcriptional regulator [Streptomyces harenosi]NEY34138.1 TetR family transcriptional regulator [Streptomyces harenosi]
MARVSQAHLDARRRQILDGAALCFARNGFHATSMQDVLKEAGLSAGAVYRYFSGKEELIGAIVAEVLGTVREVCEQAARQVPVPPPDVLIPGVLARMRELRPGLLDDGEWMFPRLMIQVWSEATRNAGLAAQLREGFRLVRAAWGKVVDAYREAGLMPAGTAADADAMARVMIAVVQGYAIQVALFGTGSAASFEALLRDGLRSLMSVQREDQEVAQGN